MGVLDGKVAIITGAGAGLGRAYALLFAKEGAKVVVNDYSVTFDGDPVAGPPMAQVVVDEIKAAGGEAVPNFADVSSPEGAASILKSATDAYGRADILVNNAGIVRDAPITEMSIDDWDRVINVHLRGTFCVSQAFFRQVVAQGGGGGVIVNTTSRTGLRGRINQANYGAAKGGIVGLSNVLAHEGKEHGIRVWTISPRAASRAWAMGSVNSTGVVTDDIMKKYTMDAVALAVLYMVSDLSAPHTRKVVFASTDSIREVRLDVPERFEPTESTTVYDIAEAVKAGKVLFTDDNFDRIG